MAQLGAGAGSDFPPRSHNVDTPAADEGRAYSEKATVFLEALQALCKQHKVLLAPEGYDRLQLWDLQEGDEPIHASDIEDCTEHSPTREAKE